MGDPSIVGHRAAMPRTPRWTPPTEPFTLADVAPLGVTWAMLRNADRLGRITRVAHGVYVASGEYATGPSLKHLQRARAHQLASARLIASHATAALGSDVPLPDVRAAARGPLRFSVEPGENQRSTRSEELILSVRRLPAEHRTTHPSGLVMTTIPRTAVDLAAESDLEGGLMALDAAARRAITDRVGERRVRDAAADPRVRARALAELRAVAEIAANRLNRPRLERALALADPRREAASESSAFALIVESGLPLPEMQVRIDTEVGAAWPDFLWREAKVILEIDGRVKYESDPTALVREKLRHEALVKLGYVIIRCMAEDVWRRPAEVVERVRRALDARGAL